MQNTELHLGHALGHEATDKRLDILRRIGEVGSISEAARGAGVSYKAAWQALDTLSNLAGTALVERAVGGAGGGGALLTPAGSRVLRAAEMLARARTDVLAQLDREAGVESAIPWMATLGLRTSMRNQLPCRVQALKTHGASIRVELLLANDTALYSRITRESAQLLGLHAGQSVLALCKATAVAVARDATPEAGLNSLPGVVSRVSRAANGGEVGLQLMAGLHLVGFAEAGHGLKVKGQAVGTVEESGVVIAVAG